MSDPAQTNLQLYNELVALGWTSDDLRRARGAYELASELFSGRYRCSGKPFVAHLVGTASAVAAAHGGPDLVLAALLHAAYDQGDFGTGRRGSLRARREIVRGVVGPEAEALVFAYSGAPWNSDVVADAASRHRLPDGVRRDVLVLQVANEIDEHTDGGARYCNKGNAAMYEDDAILAMATLMRRIGEPGLAEQLQRVCSQAQHLEVPAVLQSPSLGSHTRAPASYVPRPRVLAQRVFRKMLRLARAKASAWMRRVRRSS